MLDFVFTFALLPDDPATGLDPLVGPLFAAPLPVERDLVGETDFILETGFVVTFLGVREEGTAFFGGILTNTGFTSQILALKFKLSCLPSSNHFQIPIRYFWHKRFTLFRGSFYNMISDIFINFSELLPLELSILANFSFNTT